MSLDGAANCHLLHCSLKNQKMLIRFVSCGVGLRVGRTKESGVAGFSKFLPLFESKNYSSVFANLSELVPT